jgi:C4-type Zn-finger protein
MNLNTKISEIKKVGKTLEKKLNNEGLTKIEKNVLNEIRQFLSEDVPMSFDPEEVGGARPSRGVQSKIEGGKTPLSQLGLTQEQVDFFTSEAFKSSIKKMESLLGNYSGVERSLSTANRNLKKDAQTAFSSLYSLVGELLNELTSLQYQYQTELEEIATEAVEKAMGIDRTFFDKKLKLDGKFSGFLSKLEGMKNRVENVSEDEILNKFANIDKEKKEKLEQLKKDFEEMGADFDESKAKEAIDSTFKMSDETKKEAKKEFSDEVSRRMIINLFRRGMSIYYDNAYEICKDKILALPDGERLLQISNMVQPIMVHLYWLFSDIGSIGSSGGGQIGQIQVVPPSQPSSQNDDEDESSLPNDKEDKKPETPQGSQQPQGPFVIRARAMTFPLIVHELIKGVIMFFTSAGGTDNEKGQLAKKQATSLETEAYDLTYSEKFYEEFYNLFKEIVPDVQEQRDLTPFVLKFISEEKYEKLLELTKSLFTLGLSSDFAKSYIESLVEKSRKLMKTMGQNPSYLEKKQYKSPEPPKKDDEEEDNWDEDMSWLDDEN